MLSVFVIVSVIVGTMAVAAVGTASPMAVISVDPPITTAGVGETFTVDIIVAGITGDESLYGWGFYISFDPNILECTEVLEGPFLSDIAPTSWDMMPPDIDNTAGIVSAADAFLPMYPSEGAIGSGVLCTITFQVKAVGKTDLQFLQEDLRVTKLRTYIPGTGLQPVEHATVDGLLTNELVHDIAVIEVTPSSTSVPAGELVSINVTVKNEGSATETFDVTVLYDSTDIETKTVTDLAPGDLETLSFDWDTKDVAEGDYTITAVASEIDGEIDTADNTYTNVVVTVTAPLPGFPTPLFVAVIIVVVTMCSVVLLYTRRRRSAKA